MNQIQQTILKFLQAQKDPISRHQLHLEIKARVPVDQWAFRVFRYDLQGLINDGLVETKMITVPNGKQFDSIRHYWAADPKPRS